MMNHIKVEIAAELKERFPNLCVQGFIACSPGDAQEIRAAVPIMPAGLDADRIAGDPRIAVWREAVRAMALKAAEHRSSVEQLVRRLARGAPPVTGVAFVDAYNAASTTHLAPMGAYDIERLPQEKIAVRLAVPELDRFSPLGGRASEFPVKDTVAVYASGDEILCWAFNVRDSQVTSVSTSTRQFLVLSEALDDAGAARSASALATFSSVLQGHGFIVGAPFRVQ